MTKCKAAPGKPTQYRYQISPLINVVSKQHTNIGNLPQQVIRQGFRINSNRFGLHFKSSMENGVNLCVSPSRRFHAIRSHQSSTNISLDSQRHLHLPLFRWQIIHSRSVDAINGFLLVAAASSQFMYYLYLAAEHIDSDGEPPNHSCIFVVDVLSRTSGYRVFNSGIDCKATSCAVDMTYTVTVCVTQWWLNLNSKDASIAKAHRCPTVKNSFLAIVWSRHSCDSKARSTN